MYNKWKSDIEVNTISQYYLNIPHFGTKKTYAMNNISSFPLEDVMKIYIYWTESNQQICETELGEDVTLRKTFPYNLFWICHILNEINGLRLRVTIGYESYGKK